MGGGELVAAADLILQQAPLFFTQLPYAEAGDDEENSAQDSAGAQDPPLVGPILAAFLGVRHVCLDPLAIEDLPVNLIAHLETPLDHTRDAGQAQRADQRIGFVIAHGLSQSLIVKIEQGGHIDFAAQHPLANEQQIVIPFACPVGQEQLGADSVHVRRLRYAGTVGDREAHPLRQVGMPAGPVEDALQQRRGRGLLPVQALRQGTRFRCGEITQLDAPADVERRGPRIAYQVGRSGNPQQAERQPGQLRIFRAAVVAFADRREKFVRRERQTAHRVDLVHEDHDPA